MAAAISNAFAYVSPDIIYDVLFGYCKFDDLAPFDQLESRWANVVRSKFQKATISGEEPFSGYHEQWYDYGNMHRHVPFEQLENWSNFEALILNDVDLQVGQLSAACENQILQRVNQCVTIALSNDEERSAEIFKILSARPLTDLTICATSDSMAEETLQALCVLLENPSLGRLTLPKRRIFGERAFIKIVVVFVKKPNFQFIDCGFYNRRSETLTMITGAAIHHWRQQTAIPRHLQRFSFYNGFSDFSCIKNKFSLQESSITYFESYGGVCEGKVYYREHPIDASKRVEVLITQDEVEICFTSKEDTVWSEFGEYSGCVLRKVMQEHQMDPFAGSP